MQDNIPGFTEKSIKIFLSEEDVSVMEWNVNKIENMRFKQEKTISTLNCRTLKLQNKFTNLSSNISSIERYINLYLAKA